MFIHYLNCIYPSFIQLKFFKLFYHVKDLQFNAHVSAPDPAFE